MVSSTACEFEICGEIEQNTNGVFADAYSGYEEDGMSRMRVLECHQMSTEVMRKWKTTNSLGHR